MKKQLLLVAIMSSLLISGCAKKVTQDEYDSMESSYQQQITELESKVSELETKVTSQQEYINTMNSSIQEISSSVDRFDYEDWRIVVPDVYYAVKELENNIQTEP